MGADLNSVEAIAILKLMRQNRTGASGKVQRRERAALEFVIKLMERPK